MNPNKLLDAYTALASAESARDSALAAYVTDPTQANAAALVQAVAAVATARTAYLNALGQWVATQVPPPPPPPG